MISLNQQFKVDLPVDETWTLLNDLPKVARCMPGTNLDDVVDGEYRGGLSAKIGPINAKYRGVAVFREQDEVAHRAVIEARGREEKGSGSASAVITLHLELDGDGTLVDVSTELTISGRAAQFGRSLLTEVSNSMLDQFVRRLQSMIAQPGSGEEPAGSASAATAMNESAGAVGGTAQTDELDQSLDVVRTVAMPMLRRAAVPITTAVLGGLVGVLIGRRGRRGYAGQIPLTYVLPFPASPEAAFADRRTRR